MFAANRIHIHRLHRFLIISQKINHKIFVLHQGQLYLVILNSNQYKFLLL